MSDQQLIKEKINEVLPYGALSQIKRALLTKHSRRLTVNQVKDILDPKNGKWDVDVIAEANEIVSPIIEQINSLKEALS